MPLGTERYASVRQLHPYGDLLHQLALTNYTIALRKSVDMRLSQYQRNMAALDAVGYLEAMARLELRS